MTERLSLRYNDSENFVSNLEQQIITHCQLHSVSDVVEISVSKQQTEKIFVIVDPTLQRTFLRNEPENADKVPMIASLGTIWGGTNGYERTSVLNDEHVRFEQTQRDILNSSGYLESFTQQATDKFFSIIEPLSGISNFSLSTVDFMAAVLTVTEDLLVSERKEQTIEGTKKRAYDRLIQMKGSDGKTGLMNMLIEHLFTKNESVQNLLQTEKIHELQSHYNSFTDNIIESCSDPYSEGLLPHMIQMGKKIDAPFSEAELRATTMGIMIGAVEPFSTVLTESFYQLSHPNIWNQFIVDLSKQTTLEEKRRVSLAYFIEAARIARPALLSAREVYTPILLKGKEIPTGSIVMNLYGVPSLIDYYYADDQPATAFIPGRTDDHNTVGLLWGYGSRRCPGIMYSWKLGSQILLGLAERYDRIEDTGELRRSTGIFSAQYRRFLLSYKKNASYRKAENHLQCYNLLPKYNSST